MQFLISNFRRNLHCLFRPVSLRLFESFYQRAKINGKLLGKKNKNKTYSIVRLNNIVDVVVVVLSAVKCHPEVIG